MFYVLRQQLKILILSSNNCSFTCFQTSGRGTYMAGMVNSVPLLKAGQKSVLFSVPLLMTQCPQNAPNCTDLHLYFQKIPGGNTPGLPETVEGLSPLPNFFTTTSAHRPTYSELPRPLFQAHFLGTRASLHYCMRRGFFAVIWQAAPALHNRTLD